MKTLLIIATLLTITIQGQTISPEDYQATYRTDWKAEKGKMLKVTYTIVTDLGTIATETIYCRVLIKKPAYYYYYKFDGSFSVIRPSSAYYEINVEILPCNEIYGCK